MFNVLVVEDDSNAADLMELALLRVPGLLVQTVHSAAAAREALASDKHFSAIITDIHLPGEDGLSLAEGIRRMTGRSGVPVIVVTSSRDASLRERARQLGVHAFLEKPWSAAQLHHTVHSLLNDT